MLRHLVNAFLSKFLNPKNKSHFISQLPTSSKLLDVGCGNDSPALVKSLRPDIYYVGLDVVDYNQASSAQADEYLLIDPLNFAAGVYDGRRQFDAVISSHNLEHCFDRSSVLEAMTDAVAEYGQIFLAFPTESSVRFPSRLGTLNYYDDSSHIDAPPVFSKVLSHLQEQGFKVNFSSPRYRPPLLWLIGLFQERASSKRNRIMFGTWGFWGFEAIIWASKTGNHK